MGVLAALFVELALITYRGAAQPGKVQPVAGLPVPAEYGGAILVFGALSFARGAGATPAALFAWGLVIATALNLFPESGPTVNLPGLTFISPSTDYSNVRTVTVGST